jgi:carboxyl-terminal processing protease
LAFSFSPAHFFLSLTFLTLSLSSSGQLLNNGGSTKRNGHHTLRVRKNGVHKSFERWQNLRLPHHPSDIYVFSGFIKYSTLDTGKWKMVSLQIKAGSKHKIKMLYTGPVPVQLNKSPVGRLYPFTIPIITNKTDKATEVTVSVSAGAGIWIDHLSLKPYANSGAMAMPEIKGYLDTAVRALSFSMFKRLIDTALFKDRAAKLATLYVNYIQCQTFVQSIIDSLHRVGDRHSHLLRFVTPSAPSSELTQAGKLLKPNVKYLGDGIGYVVVPGFQDVDKLMMDLYAIGLQGMIKVLDTKQTIKGWVVDLRDNSGGNLYPMLAGLGPILGDGVQIYDLVGDTIPFSATTYDHGHVYEKKYGTNREFRGTQVDVRRYYRVQDTDVAVAVLINHGTASSGEAALIALLGLKHVRTFGSTTNGLTTGHKYFDLPDRTRIYITRSTIADRNRHNYVDAIKPDVEIYWKPGTSDIVLERALLWLKNGK